MIKVYQYSKCSTCRNALKWLDAKKVAYDSVDIVTAPPKKAELQRALKSGIPLKRLFNTSGQSYREGKWGDKLAAGLTEAQAVEALAKDGKLVKRPFILSDAGVTVGFDEATFKKTYGK
jgi:arsenate reductase (glutaredoxin)